MSCASVSKFFSNNCNCHHEAALPKALSLFPIVGPIIQLVQELSIGKSLANTTDKSKIIKLIELKNQYKIFGITRLMIELATIITITALSIISPLAGLIFGCLSGVLIGYTAWTHHHNEQAIKQLNDGKMFIMVR